MWRLIDASKHITQNIPTRARKHMENKCLIHTHLPFTHSFHCNMPAISTGLNTPTYMQTVQPPRQHKLPPAVSEVSLAVEPNYRVQPGLALPP